MANLLGTDITGAATISDRIVIGGNFSNNAYNSVSSTRLHFGGGNSDALENYYIGTNLNDYGGNYTKLDLRWHTGIRMGAQPGYGGIRFYDTEDLGTVIFSVGTGDGNVRVTNTLYINGNTAIHTGNIGSQSVSYASTAGSAPANGGNSSTVAGLSVHSGRNNEADKIVRTDSNGYIQAGWINTTSGDEGNGTPDKFYGSNDNYIRYYTRAYTQMYLGNTYHYTTARRQHTTDTNYWVGTMGWGQTNWNDVGQWGSGFVDSWSNPANKPPSGGHHVGVQAFHYRNGSTAYGWQMAQGEGTDWYLRRIWGGGWSGWYTMITSDNIASQSVNYASSAGNADTVDGYHASYFAASSTTPVINSEYTAPITTDGWYTIASYGSGRALATFHIYDVDSSRHNYAEVKVNWSYGYGGITVVNNGRHGVSTIKHVRLLYSTSSQVYGGVKIQVYCENASWTLRIRQEYPQDINGWGSFNQVSPTLENSPSGWAEYTRAYNVNERGVITTSSSDGYLGGNAIIHSGNIASQSVSYADESGYSASSGSVEWTSVQNKPATFAPSAHTHDDRYYTESESDTRYAYKEGSSGTNFYANAYYQYEWTRIMGSGSKGIYWQEGDGAYWHIYPRNQADMRFRTGSGNGGIVGTVADETARGYIHWTTSNEIGFLSEDRNWVLRTWNRGVEAYGSMRAPIFYDSSDTNYYVDPNSTSNLLTVNVLNTYVGNAIYFGGGNNYFNWTSGRIHSNVGIQSENSMRAPIFYDSNNTDYYLDPNANSVLSTVQFSDGITDNGTVRIYMPGGAWSVNSPSGTGGAIKISLPTGAFGVNTMMSMTVQVYEYSTGQSFTIRLGGYNYYNHSWYNVFAYMVNDSGKGGDVPVYFGHDGTRDVIWIGEPGWSWSYPNVFVTDFQAGHSQSSTWKTGWNVSFDTGSRTNVTQSRTAYRQIDKGNIATQAVSYADDAGFADNADTVDGYHMNQALLTTSSPTFQEVYANGWFRTTGYQGLYNPTNGTHFYPNNATYGSWRIDGTRNGWHGIYFGSGATLMMNSGETGIYRENYGWQFRWYQGEMYISPNTLGGGTERTVIHSGNIGSQSVSYATDSGSVDGIDSSRIVYGDGERKSSEGYSDMNRYNQASGFYFYNNPSNNPFGDWTNWINVMGNSWASNYGFQLAHQFHGEGFMVRRVTNGTFYSWRTIIDSGNILGQTVNYVTVNYNNDSNSTYQLLWGSGNSVYGTGDVYVNPFLDRVYAKSFETGAAGDAANSYRCRDTGGTSRNAMFVNSSNQLQIGNANFSNNYFVGSVGVNVSPSATAGRIDASNDIVAYSSSDERLKQNITPIENALDKVKSLTGVEFDWKPEYKHAHGYEGHDTGIIAQQVQEVIPSAVRTNDTGFLAVRYEKLIGLLVEGMKEQQAQIEELKAKLDGLTK